MSHANSPTTRTPRVLLVEDDPRLGERVKIRLAARGYGVTLCSSQKSALCAYRKADPDYAILDVMLGDGLGYEVARTIRRDSALYKIPILFQSIAEDEFDVQHAFRQGGDGFLVKPYNEPDLLRHLRHLTALKRSVVRECPLTGLAGVTALRREVDHSLFNNEHVALCLVSLKGLQNLAQTEKPAVIKAVIRATKDSIQSTIERCGFSEALAFHVGGGYFVVRTSLADYRRFRKNVCSQFKKHEEELMRVGLRPHLVDSTAVSSSPFSLLVSTAHTRRGNYRCATEMLEAFHHGDEVNNEQVFKVFRQFAASSKPKAPYPSTSNK